MDEGLLNDYSHVEDGVNDDDGIAMHQSRPRPFRERLHAIMEGLAVQWTIVIMICVDTLFVVVDLILELELLALSEEHKTSHFMHDLEKSLKIGSIVILSLFIVELMLKMYAEGPVKFCKSIGHVFDSVVVLTSWVFEVFFAEEEAMALIIVFRLWRVIRIVHGIVETSQSKLKAKIDKLQRQVTELEDRLRSRNSDLQREKDLRALVEDREKTYRKRLEDNERNRAGSARPHSMQVVGTTTNTSDIDIDTNMRPITPTSTTAGAGDATGDLGLDHLDSPTESQLRQARARLQTSPHEERAAMMGEQLKDGDQ